MMFKGGNEKRMEPINTDTQTAEFKVDIELLKRACGYILEAIGEDVNREGLVDTPKRFANFWKEFMEYDPGNLNVHFQSVRDDSMVVLRGIKTWSLCEHHLLPFSVNATVAYIPGDENCKVIGLSKLARIVQKHAHRPQIQERLAADIAAEISELACTKHVAVVVSGVHLCMQMRGVKTSGEMFSSVMQGHFRDDQHTRTEFLTIMKMD